MKKTILLTFFIISCSNKPVLVPNDAYVLVDDDNAISATAYNISVDSIKASITFDIRSDFDKYLLDVQNPIKKTFLIKTNKNLNFSKKLKPIFNLGISEIKNFDNVVKQSTPLGINSINCLSSERSKIRKKPSQSKIERWKKIAASSCEQCGMDWVPQIYSYELMSWAHNSNDSLKIVLNPKATKSIKDLKKAESLSIAIGPEGGFTDNEIEKLEEEGFISINCGDMIFRTDTMPIVILSMLNFSMRDIS